MTLRIEKKSAGSETVYRLSGRIAAENLEQLMHEISGQETGTALNLEYVTFVDLEGVRFLSACESRGIELLHCSPYIREWIARDRETHST
jgi:hypothetical protein